MRRIHRGAGWRACIETLEVSAHVCDDCLDDVARVTARRCSDDTHGLNCSK